MGRQRGGNRRRKFARDRKMWRPWPEDGRQFQRNREIKHESRDRVDEYQGADNEPRDDDDG